MRKGHSTSKLSVFKGRTRRLTKAIFWTLAQKAPTSAYNIYKEVRTQKTLRHTKYSVVNRRIRILETLGYIKRIGTKDTKAGFKAPLYQLTSKAYLAIILNQINLDDFIKQADEAEILTALGILSKDLRDCTRRSGRW